MGCSLSKNNDVSAKGPKRCSLGDKGIHRRIIIQANRRLKAIDRGYVAGIFTNSYGSLKRHISIKAFDGTISLIGCAGKVSAAEQLVHKTNEVLKPNENGDHDSTSGTPLGVPVDRAESTLKLSEAETPSKCTTGSLEIVNVRELMKGLPEEVSQSSDGLETSQEHSLLVSSATVQEHSVAGSCERIEMNYTIDAYSDRIATKVKHRSFSYDHIISMEVTNLVYFTERYMELLPSRSFNKAWSTEKDVHVETHPTITKLPSTMVDKVIKLEDVPVCSDSDNCIPAVENTSVEAPGWLQTSLSFKYMLNNSSIEEQTIPQKPLDIEVNETFQLHSENLVFPTSLSSCMSEYINSSLDQNFSAVTSWKDRPCSTNPLFRSLGKLICDNVISDRPSLECQDDPTLNSSEDSIFDPQLVDTFENSLRHLSKEEWDALKTMEDSPRKFLHSIQVLRKSCSSSARKQEDKGLYLSITSTNRRRDEHTNGLFKSEKTPGSKEFTDKLQAFMRQSSLEVKRASSNARFAGDKSRLSVIFYSTTQDGSKAFKDCNRVRSILKSLVGTYYDERSVSEREEHGQELRGALNTTRLIVPTLYVEGKYLVGIESILHLNKRGRLSSILGKVIVSG